MTGIELLRELASGINPRSVWSVTSDEYDNAHGLDVEHKGGQLRDFLADIADQIQREQESLVADSPYDAILPEDRDAIAWVRDHGGLDAVEKRLKPEGMEWPTVDGKPVVIGERMRSCGIDDCKVVGIDPANSRLTLASDNIEEGKATYFTDSAEYCHRPTPKVLDADGAEIREKRDVWWICEGDERGVHAERLRVETICPNGLIECSPHNGGTWVYLEPSELYVNKPVPASDGKPLREGETVWDTNGDELVIGALEDGGHTVVCRYADVGDGIPVHGMWSPSDLTHQRPVLDADGVPIREGDTVWNATTSAGPFIVREIERSDDPDEPEDIVWCGERAANGFKVWRIADQLTHTKPELDSWEHIEEDAGCTATKYNERRGTIFTTKQQVARDLVRRCRALAERERGE